jgi:hypothetical protein
MYFQRVKTAICTLLAFIAVVGTTPGIKLEQVAGAAHAYPAMLDLNGKKLANGEFTQQMEDGVLRIRITYDSAKGGRIEEKAAFRLHPQLMQKEWSWRELKDDTLQREYKVDFSSGKATARKRENGEMKEWSDQVEIERGRSFAGFGFALALQNLRDHLTKGEAIELKAVGFNPKPKVVTVKLSWQGADRVPMSGRQLRGDHFVIRPEIPAIVKVFVKLPDTHIWLTPPPAGFLRLEGPLVEPSDPLIRVDLLSGGESSHASPARRE